MKVTLKKFVENPKPLLKKAPVIIVSGKEPQFAIIPYVVYKQKYENQPQIETTHEVSTPQMQLAKKKSFKNSLLYRLLFT